jgi:hypothetical protein
MKKRVEITLKFCADLDMVPGWGHKPEDWENLAARELTHNSHYNTTVEVLDRRVVKIPYSTEPTE